MEIPKLPNSDRGKQEKPKPITKLEELPRPDWVSVTTQIRDIYPLYTTAEVTFPQVLEGRIRSLPLIDSTLSYPILMNRAVSANKLMRGRGITTTRDFLSKMPTGDELTTLLKGSSPLSEQIRSILQAINELFTKRLLPLPHAELLASLHGLRDFSIPANSETAVRALVDETVAQLPPLEAVVTTLMNGLYDGIPQKLMPEAVGRAVGKTREQARTIGFRAENTLRQLLP